MSGVDTIKTLTNAISKRYCESVDIHLSDINDEILALQNHLAGVDTTFTATSSAFQSQILDLQKKVDSILPSITTVENFEESGDISRAFSDFS